MKLQMTVAGMSFLLGAGLLGAGAAMAQQPAVKTTPLLKTTTTITGQKLVFPSQNPQVTVTLVEIPPGIEVGWHEHPNIRYVYVTEGTLTIEMGDGTRRDFPAGTLFVEAFGTPHHGLNAGKDPVKVLFIDHSEEGQSNMVKADAPALHHGSPEDRH